MIKILKEEPITYTQRNDAEPEMIEAWIYKNPTSKEVAELKDTCENVRICVDRSDYYIASSYYFIHFDIEQKVNITSDIHLAIFFKENVMVIDLKRFTPLSALEPVYNKMMRQGLINKDTYITDRRGYTDASDWNKPRLTLDTANIINAWEITGKTEELIN